MKVFLSQKMQNFSNWTAKPNVSKNINTYAPIVQSAFVSSIYLYDIYRSDIPEKNKKPMLIHDIICGVAGIILSLVLNKGVDKFKNDVAKHLEKSQNIEKLGRVCRGVKIAVPILVTSFVMRYINPVAGITIADKIHAKWQEIKNKKKVDK